MALDYGYTITIERDGTCYPDTPHTNQWQKKDQGSTIWVDIRGETGETYTVVDGDRSADIRLVQYFGSIAAPSNSLKVTSALPGCPYPDPTLFPHIAQASAENGDTLTLDSYLIIPGVSSSQIVTTWYGIKGSDFAGKTVIQNGGLTYLVSESVARTYDRIIVNQTYKPAADLDPLCVGFSPDSLPVNVTYVTPTTFGSTSLSGPTKVTVGDSETWTVSYTGDVVHYDASIRYPVGIAQYLSEKKSRNKFEVSFRFFKAGSGRVEVTLTSRDPKTSGENPVPRGKSVTAEDVPLTLGTVKLDGPRAVDANVPEKYTISWTGDAPEYGGPTWQWMSNGDVASPSSLQTEVSWDSARNDGFVWAQVSYNGDTQMPQIENIKVTAPPSVTNHVVIEVQGKSGATQAGDGDVLKIKTAAVIDGAVISKTVNQWQRKSGSNWIDIPGATSSTLTISGTYCEKDPNPEIRLKQELTDTNGVTGYTGSNSITENFPIGTGPSSPPAYGYPDCTAVSVPAKVKYVDVNECLAVGIGTGSVVVYDDGTGWKTGATLAGITPIGILYGDRWWYVFAENGKAYKTQDPTGSSWSLVSPPSGTSKAAAPGYKSRFRVWFLVNGVWEPYGASPGSFSWSKASMSGGTVNFNSASAPYSFYQYGTSTRVFTAGGKIQMLSTSSTTWGGGTLTNKTGYYNMTAGGYGNGILYQATDSSTMYTSTDQGANWNTLSHSNNNTKWITGTDKIVWDCGTRLQFATYGDKYSFNLIGTTGRDFTCGVLQAAANRWIFANDSNTLNVWAG